MLVSLESKLSLSQGLLNSAKHSVYHNPIFECEERDGTPITKYYAIFGNKENAEKIYQLLLKMDWMGIGSKIQVKDGYWNTSYHKIGADGKLNLQISYGEPNVINFHKPNKDLDESELKELDAFIGTQDIPDKMLFNTSARTLFVFIPLIRNIEKIVKEIFVISREWINNNKDASTNLYIVNTEHPLDEAHKDNFRYRLKKNGDDYFSIDYIDCSNEIIETIEKDLNENLEKGTKETSTLRSGFML